MKKEFRQHVLPRRTNRRNQRKKRYCGCDRCTCEASAKRVLSLIHIFASKADIDLVLENFKPVTAQVDETKLTLAISNLVENAIKYNTENGWVHVSVNACLLYTSQKHVGAGACQGGHADRGFSDPGGLYHRTPGMVWRRASAF